MRNTIPRMRDNAMWLYDMSIADLDERNKKALFFENGFEVAKFLKHNTTTRISRAINKTKKYVKSIDGKEYAVRVKNNNLKK
jgi:hypothetical protein